MSHSHEETRPRRVRHPRQLRRVRVAQRPTRPSPETGRPGTAISAPPTVVYTTLKSLKQKGISDEDEFGVPQKLEARVPPDRHHGAPAQLWLCGGAVVLRWTGRQWKKWRVPVKYIVTPAFFAASTTSSSRTEPPGWTTALTPAAVRISRPSGKGKNASEAA